MAKMARLGQSTIKIRIKDCDGTGIMVVLAVGFFFGLIHKDPASPVFFGKNPLTPADKFVFIGLVEFQF